MHATPGKFFFGGGGKKPLLSHAAVALLAELPKTRSGKLMRRVLRKIAAFEEKTPGLGDISAMADSLIVALMVEIRNK
jgi:acetyl-CoA synthetase